MDRDYPAVEPPPRLTPMAGDEPAEPWRQSVRAKLFGLAFGLTLALGIGLTLVQPSLYRAGATVLMTAPTAIDDEAAEANVQGVAIQSRILLGSEVTRRLIEALDKTHLEHLDAAFLRGALRVDPVPDTNLVEMAAEGEDRNILPHLVNNWIDVYLDIRAEGIHESQQQTLKIVREQLAGLDVKLAEARSALARYREEHDITSAERQENEVMARLEGLNESLNKALENEVQARAHLQTLEEAIADGKKIVPGDERDSVTSMEKELRQLKTQLASLTQNYTMEYVRKQPRFRDMPERIAELEQALAEVYAEGEERELSLARQQYAAAAQTARQLQEQLDAHEEQASEFTTIYATHEALSEDLARLEDLNRETQARLIEVQVNPVDRYPQVSVIDRPGASVRLGPDYRLWLGGSLAAALVVGILAVWLYGFLSPRKSSPAFVTLSGVHMYPQDVNAQLGNPTQGLQQAGGALLQDRREDGAAAVDPGPADGEPEGGKPGPDG